MTLPFLTGTPGTVLLDDFRRFVKDSEARRADGTTDPSSQFAKWAASNPGEITRWSAFRDAILAGKRPAAPTMATAHGRELVDAGVLYLNATKAG